MDGREEHYPDYPLFKGLQRPLEFMGIQGRYIYWAAATIGIAIVGFIIAYCLAGFVLALIVLAVTVTSGAGLILFKQRKAAGGRNTWKKRSFPGYLTILGTMCGQAERKLQRQWEFPKKKRFCAWPYWRRKV